MAGRGGYVQTDGILIARLCGSARRLAGHKADVDAAAAELRAITADVALLSRAAGAFMAGHRHDPATQPFDQASADLLLEAGADLQLAEVESAVVAQRLRTAATPPGPG